MFLWNERCPNRKKTYIICIIHKHCLAYSIHIIAINLIKFNPGLNSWVTMTLQYTGTIHKDMHICLIAFQILTLYPNVWISLLLPQKTLSPTTLQFFFVFQFCKCYICSINNTWVTDEYRGVPLTSFRADFSAFLRSQFVKFRLLPSGAFTSWWDQLWSLLLLLVTRRRCSLTRALTRRPE